MRESLRLLLEGIVDYAGLFPPAKLSMADAVRTYDKHRNGSYSAILSHYICPVSRLDELEVEAGDLLWKNPWTLSVLGKGGADPWVWLDETTREIHKVASFEERSEGNARALVMEAPLPAEFQREPDPPVVRPWLEEVNRVFGTRTTSVEQLFLEVGFTGAWEENLPRLFEVLAQGSASTSCISLGVKIRTGGLEAKTIPSPIQVAHFIAAAEEFGLPFKATAGLHHPFRHFSETLGAGMHGFLNVFGGAALLEAKAIDREGLVAILKDECRDNFVFDDEGFSWKENRSPNDRIQAARANLALSFGSCSVDEPIEDLNTMALL